MHHFPSIRRNSSTPKPKNYRQEHIRKVLYVTTLLFVTNISPIRGHQQHTQPQFERRRANNPSLPCTTIQNTSFLGPGWTLDFIVGVRDRKCDVKGDGSVIFRATTYRDKAQVAAGAQVSDER